MSKGERNKKEQIGKIKSSSGESYYPLLLRSNAKTNESKNLDFPAAQTFSSFSNELFLTSGSFAAASPRLASPAQDRGAREKAKRLSERANESRNQLDFLEVGGQDEKYEAEDCFSKIPKAFFEKDFDISKNETALGLLEKKGFDGRFEDFVGFLGKVDVFYFYFRFVCLTRFR
ncbi:hypothetical protein MHBO_000167 [Bonamia ostreae]|uniref:Uncharacterized protein n=1 Tax=Bonamia ostreae TaxID=126728 RepID=A0ABV2AFX8_9EUKA